MTIYKQPPGLHTGDFSSNDGYMTGLPFLKDPERWLIHGGRGMTPVDICTRQEGGGTIKRNLGGVFLPATLTADEIWSNGSARGGSFTKRTSAAVTAETLGVVFFGGGLTGTPNGLQCYSLTDDASISGPVTNNLKWNASNTTNGTGACFGLITVSNGTNDFMTGGSSQQAHTLFAQNTDNRNGYTDSIPAFSAGYHLGIAKDSETLVFRVANGSGSAEMSLAMNEPVRWIKDINAGGFGVFFFSKYFIRAVGQTGNWTPVVDIGYLATHKWGYAYSGLASTGRLPYIVERKEGSSAFSGRNARFLEACDGTSGVATNFQMCIGGLNQSTFASAKRANSCCQILEAYIGNDEDTSSSGKLGAIVGEMIEEKDVWLEDKDSLYDVRHAGFCSAYGIGHVDQYIKHLHTTYGVNSFFEM